MFIYFYYHSVTILRNDEKNTNRVSVLETKLSEQAFQIENLEAQLEKEKNQREFYQFIADFTFGWELWFDPKGKINYCSPSCFDLTGFTSNQILTSPGGIAELLVYETDRPKYTDFVSQSLDQLTLNQSLEFRILTLTKQMRWCMMNVRGVYNKMGKYLGIRASIHDITRLKRAMGHIQEMQAAHGFESRNQQRLQTELDIKDRELVSFLLQLSQKNELITKVLNFLLRLQTAVPEKRKGDLEQISEMLVNSASLAPDWSTIENQLEKLHPGFFARLQGRHPGISVKDKKLCAFLRLGLTSKEISGLLNITAKSVEIARVRLRKKLKLPSKTRLTNYLSQV